MNRKNVQSIEQIGAQHTSSHRGLEIAVRRGNHSDVHPNRMSPTDALELALLQHAQERNLCFREQLSDFIQEDGPAFGQFEPPHSSLHRAGECTLFMAEELRGDQGGWNSGAVHAHKHTRCSVRTLVDGPRDQLLPGAGFASNEDSRIRGSNLGNVGEHGAQTSGDPDDLLERRGFVHCFTEHEILCARPLLPLLSFLNVDSGPVPTHDATLPIAAGLIPDREPPVDTVVSPHPRLQLTSGAHRQRALLLIPYDAEIVGVINHDARVPRLGELVKGPTEVFETRAVHVAKRSVRVHFTNDLRNEIDQHSQLPFILPDPFFRSCPLKDVFPELLIHGCQFCERTSVRDRNGRLVGEHPEPAEGALVQGLAGEGRQHAEHLVAKDERMSGEAADALALDPLGSRDVLTLRYDVFDQHGRPRTTHLADLEDVHGDAAKVTLEERPVFFGRADRRPAARDQVETLRAIAALGAQEAGLTDIARQVQPDSRQGDARVRRQALDDGLQHSLKIASGSHVDCEAE